MTAREVIREIERRGGWLVRTKGSHAIYRAPGGCQTVVPTHRGDIPIGTLRSIEEHLAPCFGAGWLLGKDRK